MTRRERKAPARPAKAPKTRKPNQRTQYDTALALAPARSLVAAPRADLSFAAQRSAFLVALAHAVLVLAGRAFAPEPGAAPLLQPAAGLLLGALLLSPRRQWPLILGLAWLAQSLAGAALPGRLLDFSPVLALVACLQAYLSARLLARFYRRPFALRGPRELLGLALAALAGAALGGLLQAVASAAAGASQPLWSAWQAWGLAGWLGAVVVAAAILLWARPSRWARAVPNLRAAVEPAFAFLALAGAAGYVFGAPADTPGLPALLALLWPLLIWVAVRLGRRGAAAAVLPLCAWAAWLTARGVGPFAWDTFWLQVYLGVTALSTLALAGALARRERAAAELQHAHARLSSWARDLEQRNRQVAALTRMGDLLQSCMTVEDAYHVVALNGPQLFPGLSGALYLLTPERDRAWAAATWGPLRLPDMGFAPADCLALRRGRLYAVSAARPGRPCRHVPHALGLSYVCVPLLAMNEIMGVLHLSAAGPQPAGAVDEAAQELARAVADSLAPALGYVGLRQTVREQAIRDPLTGLFNRRYLEETLERELRRGRRGGYPVGLIMLDVDGFKDFNDTYGHEAGDAALRELGACLHGQVRGEDVACRYGGEEFTLLLPNAAPEVVRERAEQVRVAVKQRRLRHRGQTLGFLALSAGLAVFPADGATGADLLRAADRALYRAKRAGRDRVAAAR